MAPAGLNGGTPTVWMYKSLALRSHSAIMRLQEGGQLNSRQLLFAFSIHYRDSRFLRIVAGKEVCDHTDRPLFLNETLGQETFSHV